MLSFQEGGAGFETKLESWDIAARPVSAEKRCADQGDLEFLVNSNLESTLTISQGQARD